MKAPRPEFSVTGFSYRHFEWAGRALGKAFYANRRVRLDEALEDTGLRIYPEAYFSLVGLLFIISVVITALAVVLTRIIFLFPAPLLVILLGYVVPKIMASDRASKLDTEVPFAGTYISVMATGGLSPYASMRKLKDCDLLPNISKVSKDIEIDVQVKGVDPVSAMEKSAQHLPSKTYKDLMMGYASTLRTGGDVIHYLLVRTETMFKDLAIKVKAFGERAGVLMESYITISILMTLVLTIMYMTSLSMQQFWSGSLSADSFLMYAYILVPIISVLFIYLSDSQQISHPISEWGPYKIFLYTMPVLFFLLLVFFVPFGFGLTLPFAPPFMGFITWLTQVMGMEHGYEATIGMGIALLVSAIPATVAHSYYTRRGKGVERDVTNFMRDLTEARKTGASPESCVATLSTRDYGGFSPIVKTASRQIQWGMPFRVIYDTFRSKINSWVALINLYLLVDAIEVGGGTPETLDTLTRFSEELSSLEKEKKEALRPLLIMPYIGAGILLFSTIVFLGFSRTILESIGHQGIPFATVVTLLLPPLMVQVFFIGLVTGKISSGTTSAGFKHALILMVVGLALLPIVKIVTIPFSGGLG